MSGSLVIPIFGQGGELSQLYGRKITTSLRAGTPLHLYLPRPHSALWNARALSQSDEVILCESLIDALTFWVNGFRSVTAAYGTNGFGRDHLEAFHAAGTKRVLIAFDRDEAGERAASSVAKRLEELGVECDRVHFPKGMDANEYAAKVSPASKSLELVLRKAEWMGEGPAPEREQISGRLNPIQVRSTERDSAASSNLGAAKEKEVVVVPETFFLPVLVKNRPCRSCSVSRPLRVNAP
jgi:DNA primase